MNEECYNIDGLLNDEWLMNFPDDVYSPCPCGCGRKWKFVKSSTDFSQHGLTFKHNLYQQLKNDGVLKENE